MFGKEGYNEWIMDLIETNFEKVKNDKITDKEQYKESWLRGFSTV